MSLKYCRATNYRQELVASIVNIVKLFLKLIEQIHKKNSVVKSQDVPICNFLAKCQEMISLIDFLLLVSILLENPKGNL